MATVDAQIELYADDAALLKQPTLSYFAHTLRAMRLTMTGSFAAAAGEIAASREIAERTDNGNARAHYQTQSLWLAVLTGDFSAVAPYIDATRARYAAFGPFVDIHTLGVDAMREAWNPALLSDLLAAPRDYLWTWVLTRAAEIVGLLGDAQSSRRVYDLLLPHGAEVAVTGPSVTCEGARTHYLGVMAAAFRELDDAVAHLEDAIATNDGIGARPLAALSRQALAVVLTTRARLGDARRAADLAREALREARALKMAPLEESSSKLIEALESG